MFLFFPNYLSLYIVPWFNNLFYLYYIIPWELSSCLNPFVKITCCYTIFFTYLQAIIVSYFIRNKLNLFIHLQFMFILLKSIQYFLLKEKRKNNRWTY